MGQHIPSTIPSTEQMENPSAIAQVQLHRVFLTLHQPSVPTEVPSLRSGGLRQQPPGGQAQRQRPAPAAPRSQNVRDGAPRGPGPPCAEGAAQRKAGQHGWEMLRVRGGCVVFWISLGGFKWWWWWWWWWWSMKSSWCSAILEAHNNFEQWCLGVDDGRHKHAVYAVAFATHFCAPLLSAQAPSCWLNMVTPCMSSQHLATTCFIGHFQSCTMIPRIPAAGRGYPSIEVAGHSLPLEGDASSRHGGNLQPNHLATDTATSGVIRMDLVSQFPIDMVKYKYQQAEKSSIDHQNTRENTPNQSTEPRDLFAQRRGQNPSPLAAVGSCQIHNAHTSPNNKICTPPTLW